jgi:hypothetical protein
MADRDKVYRVIRNISAKAGKTYKRGFVGVIAGVTEEALDTLLERGAIAEVGPPPLSEIPSFKTKAARLQKAGIVTVEQLMIADKTALALAMNVQATTVAAWQKQAESWLHAERKESED